jgi:hypothetical protein
MMLVAWSVLEVSDVPVEVTELMGYVLKKGFFKMLNSPISGDGRIGGTSEPKVLVLSKPNCQW